MTGLRSQSAPLPRRSLHDCAHAYAAGDTRLGESLFPAVTAEILPIITRTIRNRTDDTNALDDITQETLERIWKQLQRGTIPDVKLVTYHTVVNVYRTRTGMGEAGRAGRERKGHAITMVEFDTTHSPAVDSTNEMIGAMDGAALLIELGRVNPIWSLVAQYRIDGLSQNQIATNLDTSRSEIRKVLDDIRDHLAQRAA